MPAGPMSPIVPCAGGVTTTIELRSSVLSGSLSLAATGTTTAVLTIVVAASSTATGGRLVGLVVPVGAGGGAGGAPATVLAVKRVGTVVLPPSAERTSTAPCAVLTLLNVT